MKLPLPMFLLSALFMSAATNAADPATRPAELINLGRTSLASVEGSTVNGNRAMDGQYYGVIRAFDDDQNVINNINYNKWLPDSGLQPWVIIRFDQPVAVQSIDCLVSPNFHAEFGLSDKTQISADSGIANNISGHRLEKPVKNVIWIKITFDDAASNEPGDFHGMLSVQEIRIMGAPTDATAKYTVGTPRVYIDQRTAGLAASEALLEWKQHLLEKDVKSDVTETPEAFITTYHKGDLAILRVTANKSDGKITTEQLAELAPRKK
jgi:hypothetical protein